MPSSGLESSYLVFRSGNRGSSINGDFIIIEKINELSKLMMSSEGDGLLRDSFHQASISAESISVVVVKFFTVLGAQNFL